MPTDYAIKDGRTVFDATTYTGNGATSRSITNAGQFQPDFVWLKERDVSLGHALYDIVRGVGSGKKLSTDGTVTEGGNDNATYGYVSSIDTNGFSVARGSDGSISYTNKNNGTYVAWQWKANGTAVSNTSGTITSSVSANTTAGFSIVTYTGVATDNTNYTVGHGLGVAPSFVIIKNRGWASGANAWVTWHQSQSNKLIFLDATVAADATDFTYMMPTAPSSSVLTVRSDTNVSTANRYRTNGRTDSYVAYCWAEIAGFSKFGSYVGNASADGPFVYTGFRPKFILIKNSSAVGDWVLIDTARSDINVANKLLYTNLSNAEATASDNTVDIVSNGFKIRGTSAGALLNGSGNTIIYMAFAENPFKYANAR